MCVSYVRVWECSKPRCSTARSPNRAETQTTYRSNEGGNEKVIFTNFSQLYFHSVWLCVPSASLRATSATTCHAYTTKKAEKKRGKKRERQGEEKDNKLVSEFWCGLKKTKPANPLCSYCLLLSGFLLIKVVVVWDNETLCRDVVSPPSPHKSVAKQLPLISVSRAPLNSWLQPLIWSHHNHYLRSQERDG